MHIKTLEFNLCASINATSWLRSKTGGMCVHTIITNQFVTNSAACEWADSYITQPLTQHTVRVYMCVCVCVCVCVLGVCRHSKKVISMFG